MKRLLCLLLPLVACEPPPAEGVAVGNPGDAKLTVGGSEGFALTSATALGAELVARPCAGDAVTLALGDVDLLDDAGAELPEDAYCGFELTVASLSLAGDGFAAELVPPPLAFEASVTVAGTELTLQLGDDGWLTAALVALAVDPLAIAPGDAVHDLLVSRLVVGSLLAGGPGPVAPTPAGLEQLACVGAQGRVLLAGGPGWTEHSPGGEALHDLVFADGLWVAVGGETAPRVALSADGEQWVDVPLGGSEPLWGVAWAGDRFVAVGAGAARLWSKDGASWELGETSVTDPADLARTVVCTGAACLAAGDQGGNGSIEVSGDGGETWTTTVLGGSGFYDALHDGERYVLVGIGGRRAVTVDGQALDADVEDGGTKFRGIAWDGGLYSAVGRGRTLVSPDAEQWTEATVAPELWGVAATSDDFVAVGDAGEILRSVDGEVWTEARPADGAALYAIAKAER
jgi:hypothetical protein